MLGRLMRTNYLRAPRAQVSFTPALPPSLPVFITTHPLQLIASESLPAAGLHPSQERLLRVPAFPAFINVLVNMNICDTRANTCETWKDSEWQCEAELQKIQMEDEAAGSRWASIPICCLAGLDHMWWSSQGPFLAGWLSASFLCSSGCW